MNIYKLINYLKNNSGLIIKNEDINKFISLNKNMDYMWHKRCWTFQESLLPDKLYFVNLTLNMTFSYIDTNIYFSLLLNMVNDKRFKNNKNTIFKNIINELYEILKSRITFRTNNESIQNYSAIDLLMYTSTKVCTMPEDKYYSLYGLIGYSDVNINYNIDEKTMIKKFVEHCISNCDASILSYNGNKSDLNSWKPDDIDKFIKLHNNNLKLTDIIYNNNKFNMTLDCNIFGFKTGDFTLCNIEIDTIKQNLVYFLISNYNIVEPNSKMNFLKLSEENISYNIIINKMSEINYRYNDINKFVDIIISHNYSYLYISNLNEIIATTNILNKNSIFISTSNEDCQSIIEIGSDNKEIFEIKQTCIYLSGIYGLNLTSLLNKQIILQ
jgi:hypothetical protein